MASTTGGVFYGLLTYVVFQQNPEWLNFPTLGFVFLVPFILGAITMHFWRKDCGSLLTAIFAPWIPSTIYVLIVGATGWEYWLCIVLCLPVTFGMSSLGGVLSCWLIQSKVEKTKSSQNILLIALLSFPFLTSSVENKLSRPETIRTVETAVTINASPELIWQNIIRVADIQPEERTFALSHFIGLPEPIGATLQEEGLGAVRQGHFEDGLLFNETITEWEPLHKVSFDIEADTAQADEAYLQMIGSDYVDILGGTYLLEPMADGRIRLSFTSQHRLSTNFNFYSGLWSDFLIQDFQNYILRVVKARAEVIE